MIFDFHAHPTFKPYNSRSIYDEDGKLPDQELWKERFRPDKSISKLPPLLEGEINYTSQIHLNAIAEGNLRGMCASFYPIERVFTVTLKNLKDSILYKFVSHVPGINWILKSREAKGKKFFFKLAGTLTGYDPDVLTRVHDGGYDYYKQLIGEYKYLVKYQNYKPKHGKIAYEIAKNYQEYTRIIDEGKIAYIMSVEGTNAFLSDSAEFDDLVKLDLQGNTTAVIATLEKNIKDFKSQEVPPFIITLAHHQYNFLCGHSPSFIGIAKFAFNQEGYTTDPDDAGEKIHYYLTGIKPDGKKIIRKILSKSFGKQRTLIDTKHMSAKARMDYRDMIFGEFTTQDIPIIQTHTGVNGRKKIAEATTDIESVELKKSEQKKSHFFTSSINLFDDEIVDIIRSNGLIGIMLDEKRIVGKKLAPDTEFYAGLLPAQKYSANYPNHIALNKLAQQTQNKYEYNKKLHKRAIKKFVKAKKGLECELLKKKPNGRKVRRIRLRVMRWKGEVDTMIELMEFVFLSILANQFLHIATVYKNARMANTDLPDIDPWDHVCLGSDYEGVINPLDIYYYASDLVRLESRWTMFFMNAINNPQKRFDIYREVMEPGKAAGYVQRILWGNSQWFHERYFQAGYLNA